MKTKIEKFFVKSLSVAVTACLAFLVCDSANAAGRVAVRNTPSTRRSTPITLRPQAQATITTTATETPVETATPEPEPEPEPVVIMNKSSQFDSILSESGTSTRDLSAEAFSDMIKKQREAYLAKINAEFAQDRQQNANNNNFNTCDNGLRECMRATCGEDFTKCATDGDTEFGDKLNKCKRNTTCTGKEFGLFATEIKADRDFNVKMLSYHSVITCGEAYVKCIEDECQLCTESKMSNNRTNNRIKKCDSFEKCLNKANADKAFQKCATIAKNCTEQDSGLSARMGKVFGTMREKAEEEVVAGEKELYNLRDLMRKQCERLGAMFDERSLDCVYTINFFAGENPAFPTASRKLYSGDTFFCNQEWFGINATTFKENAYRETRAQKAATAALAGAGVGTTAGLISSGALKRTMDTQNAKKALKEECASQGGTVKDGKCELPEKTKVTDQDENEEEQSEETSSSDSDISQKVAEINELTNSANLIGTKVFYTSQQSKNTAIQKALKKYQEKCEHFTDKQSGVKKALYAKGSSLQNQAREGLLYTRCEATECYEQNSWTLQDGECVKKNDKESQAQDTNSKEKDINTQIQQS